MPTLILRLHKWDAPDIKQRMLSEEPYAKPKDRKTQTEKGTTRGAFFALIIRSDGLSVSQNSKTDFFFVWLSDSIAFVIVCRNKLQCGRTDAGFRDDFYIALTAHLSCGSATVEEDF